MSETEKAKPSAGLSDLLERTKKYADVREKVDKEYGQLTNTLSETLALEERAELEVKANFESLQQAIQERNGAVEALSRIVLFRTDVNKREKELLAAMAAVILEKGFVSSDSAVRLGSWLVITEGLRAPGSLVADQLGSWLVITDQQGSWLVITDRRAPDQQGSCRAPDQQGSWLLITDQQGSWLAILAEEDRVVLIRFGHDWDPSCMRMDETLYKITNRIKNFAVIYLVDISEVPDFNKMYELYDPVTVMFFFRNKHIMIDLGTGNNNKINWPMHDGQELTDIIETVYRGARKGRGLVISPKDYSTKYKY
uniref:Thioredoxin-like protein 4A n=1 Tax=Globodera pallida TaxID=36090 RepID=A0A183CHG4_GLOPA